MAEQGKFIVFYGVNNLGKTTQAKKLVERMNDEGIKTGYLKYPVYDLEPTGPMINDYLRNGNPFKLSDREAQILYCLNRAQYENALKEKLSAGISIVAEDYSGTGIAWGVASGAEKKFLERMNNFLFKEDLIFLFDGERFSEAKEASHKHESDDDLWQRCRAVHLKLGAEYGWITVNANRTIEEIHEEIWNKIKDVYGL